MTVWAPNVLAHVISGDSTDNPNETRGCSQIYLRISEDDHVAGVDFGSRYGYVLHLLVLALTSITSVSKRCHICSVTNEINKIGHGLFVNVNLSRLTPCGYHGPDSPLLTHRIVGR